MSQIFATNFGVKYRALNTTDLTDLTNSLVAQGIPGVPSLKTFTLTPTQITGLKGSPVQVLPPSPTGSYYVVTSVYANYHFNTTGYTPGIGGSQITLSYDTAGTFQAINSPFTDLITTSANGVQFAITNPENLDFGEVQGQPIYASNDGDSNWSGGDSTLTLNIYYLIVPFN